MREAIQTQEKFSGKCFTYASKGACVQNAYTKGAGTMRKMLLSVLVAGVIALASPAANAAETYFADDFETNGLPGNDNLTASVPTPTGTSWTEYEGGDHATADTINIMQSGSPTNSYLNLTAASGNDGTDVSVALANFASTTPGTGLVQLTFDTTFNDTATHIPGVAMRLGSAYRFKLRFRDIGTDNTIQYQDADHDWNNFATPVGFAMDTEIAIKIVVDEANGDFSLWINGDLKVDNSTAPILGTASDGVNKVEFKSNTYYTGNCNWDIDNVVVPEPATMTLLLLGLPFALRRRRRS